MTLWAFLAAVVPSILGLVVWFIKRSQSNLEEVKRERDAYRLQAEAKTKEAAMYAEPHRSKRDVVERLRSHLDD